MSSGHLLTTMAAPSRIRFFQNVCQLVNTSASPKHPQSVTGSDMASQSVKSVMMIMITSTAFDTSRLRMAKSRQIPRKNSTVESSTEAASVIRSGTYCAKPQAAR